MTLNQGFYNGVPIVEAYYNGERIALSDIVVYGTVEDELTIGDAVSAKVGQSDAFEIVSTVPMSESIYPTKFAGEVVEIDGELEITSGVVPSSLEARAGEIKTPLAIDEEVNPTPAESDIFDPNGKVEIDGKYEAFGAHSDTFDPDGEVSISDNTEAFAPSVILDEIDESLNFGEEVDPKTASVILDEAEDSMGFSEEIECETPRIILACICDTLELDEEVETDDIEGATPVVEGDIEISDSVEGDLVPPPNIIQAGIYEGKTGIDEYSVKALNIQLPISFIQQGRTINAIRIAHSTFLYQLYYYRANGDSDLFAVLSGTSGVYYTNIATDDKRFTVTADTEVSETQFSRFNTLFQLVQN